jgi:hypothetical protein
VNTGEVLAKIDALIVKADAVIATYRPSPPGSIGFGGVAPGLLAEWRTQSLTFLTNLVGPDHTYTTSFNAEVSGRQTGHVGAGVGILRAVREDVEGGFLRDVRELVAADVFSDFLEMASHLLETGYKDPAASLAGAVLEDGLRRLCHKKHVTVRPRDDLSALNSKLAAANIYNRLVQKKLQVWTDVRNQADHGAFGEYTEQDVTDMVRGVNDFLSSHLA